MSKIYLKKASFTAQTDASNVHQTVQSILSEIEEGGDQKALEYAAKFDKYEGNILNTYSWIEALIHHIA